MGHLAFITVASQEDQTTSWLKVNAGIACFVLQYWLSGVLESRFPNLQLLALLTGLATAQWAAFDRSRQGRIPQAMLSIYLGIEQGKGGGGAIQRLTELCVLFKYPRAQMLCPVLVDVDAIWQEQSILR